MTNKKDLSNIIDKKINNLSYNQKTTTESTKASSTTYKKNLNRNI